MHSDEVAGEEARRQLRQALEAEQHAEEATTNRVEAKPIHEICQRHGEGPRNV